MQSKITKILISVILIMVLFLGVTKGVKAADYTLTLATYNPADSYRGSGGELLKEKIEEYTDGKVKVKIHWSESLLKSGEILGGIERGIVDIGLVNPAYYPERLALHQNLLSFPELPESMEDKIKVINEIYELTPAYEKEHKELNQKPLFHDFVQPLTLVSTEKVTKLDDFEGMNVRASAEPTLEMLEAVGANAVEVPWGECYMALDTGTVDGVFTNTDGITATKLYEPAPYTWTHPSLALFTPYSYNINLDTWNSLPNEIQNEIMEASKAAQKEKAKIYDKEYENQVEIHREKGSEVVIASEESVNKWFNLDAVDELQSEYANLAEEKGIENGEKLVDQILEIINKHTN